MEGILISIFVGILCFHFNLLHNLNIKIEKQTQLLKELMKRLDEIEDKHK